MGRPPQRDYYFRTWPRSGEPGNAKGQVAYVDRSMGKSTGTRKTGRILMTNLLGKMPGSNNQQVMPDSMDKRHQADKLDDLLSYWRSRTMALAFTEFRLSQSHFLQAVSGGLHRQDEFIPGTGIGAGQPFQAEIVAHSAMGARLMGPPPAAAWPRGKAQRVVFSLVPASLTKDPYHRTKGRITTS